MYTFNSLITAYLCNYFMDVTGTICIICGDMIAGYQENGILNATEEYVRFVSLVVPRFDCSWVHPTTVKNWTHDVQCTALPEVDRAYS